MAFPARNNLGHAIPDAVCCMFVWDQRLISSSMAQYIAVPPFRLERVRGDTRQRPTVSVPVRNAEKALVYWTLRLHDHGFSLNGRFFIDGFCVLMKGTLMGTRALYDLLIPLDHLNGSTDLVQLAAFSRTHVYRIPQFGPAPPEVDDFLLLLRNGNITPNEYIVLKSHPVHADAIGQSSTYIKLYDLLMAVETRDNHLFMTIMMSMAKSYGNLRINRFEWISNGMKNQYIRQMMRFTFKPGPTPLIEKIKNFLSSSIKVKGTVDDCLRVCRNGEAHLIQDYCGDDGAEGVEEAFHAAIAAAIAKEPLLAFQGNNPKTSQDVRRILAAPFPPDEALAIATAIVAALRANGNSREEARDAAAAAARFIASQQIIYVANPLVPVQPPAAMNQAQFQFWQATQRNLAVQNYNKQQADAAARATQAAHAAQLRLRQAQPQMLPTPLIARNMFDVKDATNMLNLMESKLLCILHRTMFRAGELQQLEFHWVNEEVYL